MKTKIVIIIVLAVLLIIFVLQNTEMVIVKFWFWDASIPRALLLFVTFSVGLIIGLMVPTSQKRREQIGKNEQTEEQSL
jgi:putative membrane protein